MIEYDKITKEALYALAVELEQQIEAAEQEKANQQESLGNMDKLRDRAENAEDLAYCARIERDDVKQQLAGLQESIGDAGLAILECGAGTE